MKLIQYGAGNIGRSLAGQLFSAAGWEVVFVDVVQEVIEALDREGRYRVVVKEERPDEIWVEGVRGVNGRDVDRVAEEIADCDLLSTAVGSKVLPHIAGPIAKGLEKRNNPLDIVLCENLRGAPELMKSYLRQHLPADFPIEDRVGLIATSIGKMVPIMPPEVREVDPLEVWAEAYNQIIADREGFIGEIPKVEGLVVHGCFEAYVDQKLFVHNMGHAVSAYLGDRVGAVTISEAMGHENIARTTQLAMEESGKALVSLYSQELDQPSMQAYIDDLIHRFKNPALGDTVYRVGRDRMRKYAPEDRLVGSLKAQRTAGIDSTHTLKGLAAGLLFSAADPSGERLESDLEFERIFREKGAKGVLIEVCDLDPIADSEWFARVEGLLGT
ncbi:MAG: mannitol-1-phosphate 5-dehydrogenase [Candidatus Omnitrophica bacterium]|nr:mannitol-1-phosphate 5-dehydrogenase [Candidatus Omnitrophota bacterium]